MATSTRASNRPTAAGRIPARQPTGDILATIGIVGATGGIGQFVVQHALEAGHTVHALARDPSKVAPRDGLVVFQGDVCNAATLDDWMRGVDHV